MVLDGAGWHRADDITVPKNIRLLPLPPYSPELNPVENIWEELREKNFDNKVFASLDALEEQLIHSLKHLEDHPEISQSIAGWPWIINSLLM
jgi:transposase